MSDNPIMVLQNDYKVSTNPIVLDRIIWDANQHFEVDITHWKHLRQNNRLVRFNLLLH